MSTGFVTAPVKGQVTVLWNFLCLGGKNLMAFFSEQYRLLESVFSSLQSVSLYLSSFPELQSDTKYLASFVLQCKDRSYCSQYAFKFETTQGTNFLLCLLENEFAHNCWICTHYTCDLFCRQISLESCALTKRKWHCYIPLIYLLDLWLETSIFTKEILTGSCVVPLRSWTKCQHKAQWMVLTTWGESAEEHNFAVCG